MTVRGVRAALVIADDIPTNVLAVAVVGVGTGYDNTPLCALGGQARTGFWRALTIAFS